MSIIHGHTLSLSVMCLICAAGTKERNIPVVTGNPMTFLFNYVSCPNYTYEVSAIAGSGCTAVYTYSVLHMELYIHNVA